MFPGVENFTPHFGTKKNNNVGLSTKEGCRNLEAHWLQQRPIVVSENSSVTSENIQYNAVIEISASYVTLTLKPGSYTGCKLTIISTFSDGKSYINTNASTTKTIEAKKI